MKARTAELEAEQARASRDRVEELLESRSGAPVAPSALDHAAVREDRPPGPYGSMPPPLGPGVGPPATTGSGIPPELMDYLKGMRDALSKEREERMNKRAHLIGKLDEFQQFVEERDQQISVAQQDAAFARATAAARAPALPTSAAAGTPLNSGPPPSSSHLAYMWCS